MKNKWAGEMREIIQIGVITVSEKLEETWQLRTLIRPRFNSILSEYIKDLTGISQADVDNKSVPLGFALQLIEHRTRDMTIYAYGRDDRVIFENCTLLGIECPIEAERFKDSAPIIRPMLTKIGIDWRNISSGSLITVFGKEAKRPHDALNDVQNLLEVLKELRKRGCV